MSAKNLILAVAICLVAPIAAHAQAAPANPVVSSAREIFDRQTKYILGAAQAMPAEKYGYRPTPEQWTFGKIISHVTTSGFRRLRNSFGYNRAAGFQSHRNRPERQAHPRVAGFI